MTVTGRTSSGRHPGGRRPTAGAKNLGEVLSWLASEPGIAALAERFPEQWEQLSKDAARHGTRSDDDLRQFVRAALRPTAHQAGHARPQAEIIRSEVRRHMLLELLRQRDLAAETGLTSGTVRFNRLNGALAQQLLFHHDLVRKPVSMAAYRLIWPLMWQRRILLPLVRGEGIYAFYSTSLVRRLSKLIGTDRCLEIGAGDGTLTRFLRDEGTDVVATDNYSWSRYIRFDGSGVEKLDARQALHRYQPRIVICAWPPPANPFEKYVFETSSVQTYIVITSSSRANAGDWNTYESQTAFDVQVDRRMTRSVLPIGRSQVFVFRRRDSNGPS